VRVQQYPDYSCQRDKRDEEARRRIPASGLALHRNQGQLNPIRGAPGESLLMWIFAKFCYIYSYCTILRRVTPASTWYVTGTTGEFPIRTDKNFGSLRRRGRAFQCGCKKQSLARPLVGFTCILLATVFRLRMGTLFGSSSPVPIDQLLLVALPEPIHYPNFFRELQRALNCVGTIV
jgi:hypothetical protein